MTTPTARDYIVTAQNLLDKALALLPPDPPPSYAWSWPVAGRAVDPNSAAKVAAFQVYAVAANGGPYFTSAVAHATAPAGTPAYAVTLSQQTQRPSMTAPIPVGTRPGNTADASLYVLGPDGVEYDFSKAVYNTSTRKISGADYGAPVPVGAAYSTAPGSGNAACFPLGAGPITPADLQAFAADPTKGLHPLVFSCPNVGPAPNPYPARPDSLGYPANTGIPLGTCLANLSGLAPPATAPILERFINACLAGFGMYCRDINPAPYGTLSIIGTDEINQGDNAALWSAAGVSLPIKTGAGYAYACKLSAAIPWPHLSVIASPPSS